MKGVQRFGMRGKLAPRYVGPFPITEHCGPVAYRVELPSHLSAVHNIFHVSQLKKCLRVPTEAVEMENLQLEPDLVYQEHPVKIVDHKTRVTRNQTSSFYKVQWSNHSKREVTWETKEFLKTNYPEFLATHQGTQLTPPSVFQFNVRTPKSRDEISFRGKDCNTRILRPLARILRAWSFYSHDLVIWTPQSFK